MSKANRAITNEEREKAATFDKITQGAFENEKTLVKVAALNEMEKHFAGRSSSMAAKYPHYHFDCGHLKTIDIYQFLALLNLNDPSTCLGHAFKKIAAAGKRGAKDAKTDVKEAINSLIRYLEIYYPEEADVSPSKCSQTAADTEEDGIMARNIIAEGYSPHLFNMGRYHFGAFDEILNNDANLYGRNKLVEPKEPGTPLFATKNVEVTHTGDGEIVITISKP